MAYFVIIRGPLGCGKTTIASKIAAAMGAAYVSVDAVLAENGLDVIDTKIGCIPVENFIKADRLMAPAARKNLDGDRIVIFDACFYHREAIDDLMGRLSPYRGFVFSLNAPLEICIERDRKRAAPYGKTAVRDVYRLVARLDYGTTIDISGRVEDAVKEIISRLHEV